MRYRLEIPHFGGLTAVPIHGDEVSGLLRDKCLTDRPARRRHNNAPAMRPPGSYPHWGLAPRDIVYSMILIKHLFDPPRCSLILFCVRVFPILNFERPRPLAPWRYNDQGASPIHGPSKRLFAACLAHPAKDLARIVKNPATLGKTECSRQSVAFSCYRAYQARINRAGGRPNRTQSQGSIGRT
ncbi:hypothetical protein Sulac_0790 [Sulfobacillus acidophilus DSM 10332]|uniref:Uncharacterized protein n=1 Tax=Sulfobacillus acidophilus (strain ATCC 700253 / DSM 10332 / NAL) TaxID=679936 RepID=G8U160_SULAD|nr:hypothetical protein Sulac_0790 [Sulfobacillus acidophilus DSM 10332]